MALTMISYNPGYDCVYIIELASGICFQTTRLRAVAGSVDIARLLTFAHTARPHDVYTLTVLLLLVRK